MIRASLAVPLVAGIGTPEAAAPDPHALPREWALASATNDGARAAEGAMSEEPSRFGMAMAGGHDGLRRIIDHHSAHPPR